MEQRKKKLFICITKSNWGGAQKYVFDIATNTPKDKFDTTVLLGGDGELKRRLDETGIRTILLKNSQRDINTQKEFGLFFELLKIFLKEKPDIIHLNSSKMGGTGALAGRIAGIKKIIFTGHGWAFNEDRSWISKIVIKILHIVTILLCHKTIAVSEITKKQIGRPFNKKMTVIYNGLKPIDFKNEETAQENLSIKILKKYPKVTDILETKPIWVGTISELHKTKGLDFAINAISKIRENVIFVIIGEGEERKNLEQLIFKLGLSNKVFLVGRIENASEYLKAFDIFTLTSITEALPYALLETGQASLPIVASNVGGIPEIIDNQKSGILVEPGDIEGIQKAIEKLINDPEKSALFGQTLKSKVEKEFTQEKMLEKTFRLYC